MMKKTFLLKTSLASLSVLTILAQPTFANDTIHFSSCTEAWQNGYSDIHRGEPGYSSRLDKDGDGVACERSKAPRGVFKPRQSNSQARRDIKANAVSINQEKISDEQLKLGAGEYILQVGKRKFAKVKVE